MLVHGIRTFFRVKYNRRVLVHGFVVTASLGVVSLLLSCDLTDLASMECDVVEFVCSIAVSGSPKCESPP